MILKVVSGGQTGVDQAGLFIASEVGLEIGGWCPKGGLDENKIDIRKQFPSLVEATTANPDERTKLNIRDSDGTLIIVPSWPLLEKIKDGTLLTIAEAQRLKKPYLIFSLTDKEHNSNIIKKWVQDYYIEVLNIAGPRESNSPGINEKTREALVDFFSYALQLRARL
jgi:hypothetical protein